MAFFSIDETHDPSAESWLTSANDHPDFPLQNLPLGRFSAHGSAALAGVAVGDSIVDLSALLQTGLLNAEAKDAAQHACSNHFNPLLGIRPDARRALRRALFGLLNVNGALAGKARAASELFLISASKCEMHLPAVIGNYSDFNAGIHHSANGGRRRGLKDPLLPNYRHVPVAYHSRASSVCPSGTPVRRPWGQYCEDGMDAPVFAPSRKLDFELELGFWVGKSNTQGVPVSIKDAADSIAGYCLLNDWSARDIQAWESPRLGPFLGKSFCTTISPWVISPEALAPFLGPAFRREPGDPLPLPHLLDPDDQAKGHPQLACEVWMKVSGSPEQDAICISNSHSRNLYWTPAQMLTHHASNGCNLQVGDLMGTGTITGTELDSFGTLLDAITPTRPILTVGEQTRTFLEDGDVVSLRARARRDGFAQIGFGACVGLIAPAMEHR